MSNFVSVNRRHWDAVTPGHVASDFYDVESFKAGRDTIDDVESGLVGGVVGMNLLHLQCHFGLDTMSWTRRGAIATGVDFSEVAISAATGLAFDLKLNTRFRVGNVLALDLGEEFDIVFSSHGVLGWLPELRSWARTVAKHLKPHGRFVLVDGHPVLWMFDDERSDGAMRLRYDYFSREALAFEETGSYADPHGPMTNTLERLHPIEDVLGALVTAGLTITGFREYDQIAWQAMPHMVQDQNGWWRLPADTPRIPLMFSVTATR
ncbi:MAG: class I SAM-dependent methyltransferase [Acidimicrobiia bacterium]|nr:class I SAM-dependent methyltransferase [Acidimicrobiia bacterium]